GPRPDPVPKRAHLFRAGAGGGGDSPPVRCAGPRRLAHQCLHRPDPGRVGPVRGDREAGGGVLPPATRGPPPASPPFPTPHPPFPISDSVLSTEYSVLSPPPPSGPARSEKEKSTSQTENAAAAVVRVRALANQDPAQAEQACAEAVALYPLEPELHYLHSVLLL